MNLTKFGLLCDIFILKDHSNQLLIQNLLTIAVKIGAKILCDAMAFAATKATLLCKFFIEIACLFIIICCSSNFIVPATITIFATSAQYLTV